MNKVTETADISQAVSEKVKAKQEGLEAVAASGGPFATHAQRLLELSDSRKEVSAP